MYYNIDRNILHSAHDLYLWILCYLKTDNFILHMQHWLVFITQAVCVFTGRYKLYKMSRIQGF